MSSVHDLVYRLAFAGILAEGMPEHLSNQDREMWFQRAARIALALARLRDETFPEISITVFLPMREIITLCPTLA